MIGSWGQCIATGPLLILEKSLVKAGGVAGCFVILQDGSRKADCFYVNKTLLNVRIKIQLIVDQLLFSLDLIQFYKQWKSG